MAEGGPGGARPPAMILDRADEIKRLLIERYQVPPNRLESVGVGWREPIGKDPDPDKRMEQNRRVEVQWFTVE